MRHSLGTVQTTTCVGESVTEPAVAFLQIFLCILAIEQICPYLSEPGYSSLSTVQTPGEKATTIVPMVAFGGENKKEAGTLNERSPGDSRLHDSGLRLRSCWRKQDGGMPQVSIWLSGK